jgi:lysophospholipid acyltransferase
MRFSNQWNYEFLLTDGFLRMPIWKRLLTIQIIGLVARTKYYFAWKLSEGACNLSGLGYTGPNPTYIDSETTPNVPQHLWDRCENVDILGFELAPNPKLMIDAWNKKTVSWLRHTIYTRLVHPKTTKSPPSSSSSSSSSANMGPWVPLITYLVSALWHGFHIGYYFTFVCGALFNMVGRSLRRHLRPLFLHPSKWAPGKPFYDFFGWLGTLTTINIMVSPFMLWRLKDSIVSWDRVGWYHVFGLVVILGALDGFGLGKRFVRDVVGRKVGAVYEGKGKVVGGLQEELGGLGNEKEKETEMMVVDESGVKIRSRRDSGASGMENDAVDVVNGDALMKVAALANARDAEKEE